MDLADSEPAKEREDDMSSLAIRFAARMRKRTASSQGETTPCSKLPGGKLPKLSGPDEGAQNIPIVITVNSLECASNTLLALEGTTQEALKEACASLEDGVPTGGTSQC